MKNMLILTLSFILVDGDWWTDEYKVKPIGVLEPPTLEVETREAIEYEKRASQEWILVQRELE